MRSAFFCLVATCASAFFRRCGRVQRHRRPLAAGRPLDEARRENDKAHREECGRSEKAFFFSAGSDAPPPTSGGGRFAWEAFRFGGGAPRGVIDATPPVPFGVGDLARVSRRALFSAADCAAVVAEAEADRAWRGAQPLATYARNASVFRPVRELARTRAWLDRELETTIFPAVEDAFGGDALRVANLRCSAATVVKYNASAGQTTLGVHRDGPLVTGLVPLNGLEAYEGGGTFVEALDDHRGGVLKRDVGHLILHPATLRHGGAPVTSGIRYVLVVWLFSADHAPHWHYATQRAARYLADALRIPPRSGSAYREDLLRAAAAGFDEAIALGADAETESARVGKAQALLELGGPGAASRAALDLAAALEGAPRNAHAAALLARARGGDGESPAS